MTAATLLKCMGGTRKVEITVHTGSARGHLLQMPCFKNTTWKVTFHFDY